MKWWKKESCTAIYAEQSMMSMADSIKHSHKDIHTSLFILLKNRQNKIVIPDIMPGLCLCLASATYKQH